ncbi:MAG: rRNA maturation RNase YbeY [Waddliaceae bacterium]
MNVHIFDQQHDLTIATEQVRAIVQQVITGEGGGCDEVAVHFVGIQQISSLHQRFFNDASPTDCLSFPIDSPNEEGYCVLGDAFICPKVALEYANENHEDPYEEITRYLVHSLLHLLGYDDQGPREAEMRRAEDRYMKQLMQRNLLLKKPS